MHKHKIKFGSKELTITEPTGEQAAVFLSNSRAASKEGDYSEVVKVTKWFVGDCTDYAAYSKLPTIEQAKVVSTILSMATGTYDAPK